MKKFVLLLLSVFVVSGVYAQNFDDKLSTIPHGTILTLKKDYLIQPFEGTLSFDVNSDNYDAFNLVFASSKKRRMMRKGTQFIVNKVELEPNVLIIKIESKINYIYFGGVKSRDNLLIKELSQEFDIEFPGIEDF